MKQAGPKEIVHGQKIENDEPGNSRAVTHLITVLEAPNLCPANITLEELGEENLRLVRSFSFVGETIDEINGPPESPE